VEGLVATISQKSVAAKNDRENLEDVPLPCIVIAEDIRSLIEKIAFATWQAEHLAEIDFQEVLGDRTGTAEIEPPVPAVCQDAPAQPAVRNIVNTAQVAEHLRRGHAILAGLPGVGAIQRAVPAFRLDYTDAMLKALPGIERHRFLFSLRIRE
jgi:hypothetical protein